MFDLTRAEPGSLLFHYTKSQIAFDEILRTSTFKFSGLGEMRDPLENRQWYLPGGWWGEGDSAMTQFGQSGVTFNKVRDRARLAAFSIDREDCSASRVPIGRGWARASMWEHYAENHAGVCLIFDRDALIEAFTSSIRAQIELDPYHRRVRYVDLGMPDDLVMVFGDGYMDGSDQAVYEFIESNKDAIFFQKAEDWASESEYRFLTTLPDEFHGELFTSIGSSLRALLVGEDFPKWSRPQVQKICDGLGVPALGVFWSHGRPIPRSLTPQKIAVDQSTQISS